MGATGDQHQANTDLITETSFLKIWRTLLIEIYDPEYRITDKKIIFDFINVLLASTNKCLPSKCRH